MHEVSLSVPEREILSISRHGTMGELGAYVDDAFAHLRGTGPGLEGMAGAPYLTFYGEVGADGDGPVEPCRPVHEAADALAAGTDAQLRREAAHEEAQISLTTAEASWPAVMPAIEDLYRGAGTPARRRLARGADRRPAHGRPTDGHGRPEHAPQVRGPR